MAVAKLAADLRRVVDSLPALVALVTPDHRYGFANAAYREWFGQDPEAIAGRHVRDVLGEEAYAALAPRMEAALRGEAQVFEMDAPYARRTRRIRAHYIPQRGLHGEPAGFASLVLDVTQERRLERERDEARADLSDFIENSNAAMHSVDRDGRILWANRAELALLGYEAHEYVGRPVTDFHADAETIGSMLATLRAGGRIEGQEARLRRKDGTLVDVLVSSTARMEGSRLLSTRCLTTDISRQKQAEREREAAEAQSAQRARQQAALVRLSHAALRTGSLGGLFCAAVDAIVETLGHEYVLLLRQDGEDAVIEAVRGYDAPVGARVPLARTAQAAHALRTRKPVVVHDARSETVLPVSPESIRLGLRGGVTVPIAFGDAPWGVVATHTRRPLGPHEQDAAFVVAVANIVGATLQRHEREQEVLREVQRAAARERQQAAVAHLGQAALAAQDLAAVFAEAARAVATTLGHEFSAILQWHPETGDTELVGQHGWGDEALGRRTPADPDTQAGYTLRTGEATVVGDFASESRFRGHQVLRERGIVCGMSVLVQGQGRPWGLITTHARHPVPYTLDDPSFLQAVANVVAFAVRRFHAEAELREANAKLQVQDAKKSQFLNLVAHELKTPLTPIMLRLHVLRQELRETHGKDLDMLDRNLKRLGDIVTQLLDVARIESGRGVVVRRPCDLAELARDIRDSFGHSAAAAGVALEVDAASVVAEVDEGRIHQVLVNLVSNAIKYTPRGGRVRIEVRAQDGGALLAVEDTGMGFSPDQAAELFRPFSQPHGQRLGGFGLGLHISRLLTEMHGGTIQGASAGPGHGARFEVRLPCAAPTLAERATA